MLFSMCLLLCVSTQPFTSSMMKVKTDELFPYVMMYYTQGYHNHRTSSTSKSNNKPRKIISATTKY
jgi:hypothetical protein